jgi:hypothetical protein
LTEDLHRTSRALSILVDFFAPDTLLHIFLGEDFLLEVLFLEDFLVVFLELGFLLATLFLEAGLEAFLTGFLVFEDLETTLLHGVFFEDNLFTGIL